jgi:hypothetical protein
VQEDASNDPPAAASSKETVPVGVTWVPESVSETVAVQSEVPPSTAGVTHETVVEVVLDRSR